MSDKKWEWVTVPKFGQQVLVERYHKASAVVIAAENVLDLLAAMPQPYFANKDARTFIQDLRSAVNSFYGGNVSDITQSGEIRGSDAAAQIWQAWEETVRKLSLEAGQVSDSQCSGSEERDHRVRTSEAGDSESGGDAHLSSGSRARSVQHGRSRDQESSGPDTALTDGR